MQEALLDTSFIVALMCKKDIHHPMAVKILEKHSEEILPVVTDIVLAETLSVLARRAKEWKFDYERYAKILMEKFNKFVRFSLYMIRNFNEIAEITIESQGRLSFNDALLIKGARVEKINLIVTFDMDFKTYMEVIDAA